jgi:molybdopterin-guanine dinucleotide biosynthesis protein A
MSGIEMLSPIAPEDITLGLIAGGRASRLGGIDKAWLTRGGVPQVLRWTRRFPGEHGPVLVSANRDPQRYAAHGLMVVGDRHSGLGPIGGLDALAQACATPWLMTLPVDLVGANDCLIRTLVSRRDADGAFARDDDGVQPLVALWRVEALRAACDAAIANGETAIHRLQATLRMAEVAFAGFRFGNLNTPDDLRAAGIDPESGA